MQRRFMMVALMVAWLGMTFGAGSLARVQAQGCAEFASSYLADGVNPAASQTVPFTASKGSLYYVVISTSAGVNVSASLVQNGKNNNRFGTNRGRGGLVMAGTAPFDAGDFVIIFHDSGIPSAGTEFKWTLKVGNCPSNPAISNNINMSGYLISATQYDVYGNCVNNNCPKIATVDLTKLTQNRRGARFDENTQDGWHVVVFYLGKDHLNSERQVYQVNVYNPRLLSDKIMLVVAPDGSVATRTHFPR